MRIVQIIDSLEAGGAERMAVNYANALAQEIEFSGLVATRQEGPLVHQISFCVSYLFLKKKSKFDIGAVFRLRSYVIKNEITHVHAHSTSFFTAFLLKLTLPSLKVIRHHHYGYNESLASKSHLILKLTTSFFYGVIAVNQNLKKWLETELKAKNVVYFSNFSANGIDVQGNSILKGIEGKRIVSLANLRCEKDHFLLIEVARKLKVSHSDWSFHLIGKDFEDDYSREIKENIKEYNLSDQVFLYGSREDVANVLRQAEIAILTSKSEGLPVALLEYGQCKKAIVVTDVGEIPFIVQHLKNGMIVPAQDAQTFYDALVECIENKELRLFLGNRLFEIVSEKFSEKTIIKTYLNWLQKS